jgi:hypothetical protein
MVARNITAANATIILTAPDVVGAPVQLQGFSTDNIYDMDAVEPVETMMGVDGVLSGGYTPKPLPQVFMIQADSPSIDFFEAIQAWQQTNLAAEIISGTALLLGPQKLYSMPKGYLTSYQPLPPAHKVLQARRFTITWQGVFSSPSPTLVAPSLV